MRNTTYSTKDCKSSFHAKIIGSSGISNTDAMVSVDDMFKDT
jgi:hypothetical protein